MSTYIHGVSDEEEIRLGLMNEILNARCLAALAPRKGERILEVGCGTGIFARLLAKAAGTKVTCIDESADQLERARRLAEAAGEGSLLELRRGDALKIAWRPGEQGSFDLVHARFVLEHLAEPQLAVDGMAAALRKGGRLVLVDDDLETFRIHPEPPGFMNLWRAYARAHDRLGVDPFVGRRLAELTVKAGLTPRRTEMINYSACCGDRTFALIVENVRAMLEGARTQIVATGALDDAAFDAAIAAMQEAAREPMTAIWYSLPLLEAVESA